MKRITKYQSEVKFGVQELDNNQMSYLCALVADVDFTPNVLTHPKLPNVTVTYSHNDWLNPDYEFYTVTGTPDEVNNFAKLMLDLSGAKWDNQELVNHLNTGC